MSSARTSLASPSGRLSRLSTAGAKRRNQRRVPSVIARTAARLAAPANGDSATSALRPSNTIADTARVASTRAAAAGAH